MNDTIIYTKYSIKAFISKYNISFTLGLHRISVHELKICSRENLPSAADARYHCHMTSSTLHRLQEHSGNLLSTQCAMDLLHNLIFLWISIKTGLFIQNSHLVTSYITSQFLFSPHCANWGLKSKGQRPLFYTTQENSAENSADKGKKSSR